jgi:type VI secretion system secreted protein VgrG
VTVEGAETHTAKADFTLQVEGNFTLSVKGNITIQTDDGSITIHGSSIENAAKRDMAIKAESIQTEAGKTMVSKAGTTNTVEAGNSVEIKGGVIHLN